MATNTKKNKNEEIKSLQHKIEELNRWFRIHDSQIRVLERERQKFSAVVNHTDASFIVVDSSLKINWVNDIFRKKFNFWI